MVGKAKQIHFIYPIKNNPEVNSDLIIAFHQTQGRELGIAIVYVENGTQKFLWDNAPHHSSIETYPYHMHDEFGNLRPWNGQFGQVLNEIGLFSHQIFGLSPIEILVSTLRLLIENSIGKLLKALNKIIIKMCIQLVAS